MKKESIRKKIDEAKARIDVAFKEEDVPPGIKAAVESLLLVLEIVVVLLLEKKTRKNSSNSGLPPSRNNGANGNRNKDNDDRAKKGEQLENTRKVTTSEVVSPSTCSECDASLTATKTSKTEERVN